VSTVGRNRKQLTPVVDRPRRVALARELCTCHDLSGLTTLAELADASGVHVATVRRTLNADAVPEWEVVARIADATRADARTRHRLENLWRDARLESRPAWYRPGPLATREPATIGNYAQLRESLLLMLRDAGSPSMRELEAKAGLNLLPHSTLERTLAGKRKPTPDEVAVFVEACDTYRGNPQDWVTAVERCSAGTRTDGIGHIRTVGASIDAIGQLKHQRDQRLRFVATRQGDSTHLVADVEAVRRGTVSTGYPEQLSAFAQDLQMLRLASGKPTLHQIEWAAPSARPLSPSSVSDILAGKRLPRLDFLLSLVRTLLSIQDGQPVDRGDPRIDLWRARWVELERARASAPLRLTRSA
jgi:transcriptional regulator with XRE-family HTH domain